MRRAMMMFVLGVGGAVFSIFGQDHTPTPQIELVRHPEAYSGKLLIVRGTVVSGPEMTIMILPAAGKEPSGREAMVVVLSEDLASRPDAAAKRLVKRLKKRGSAEAVLEGKFEAADGRVWGHQACCRFRLEVARVLVLEERQKR
jgi:hypothetical protein